VGDFYGRFPKEALFSPLDDYAYVYHLHRHVIQFYTGAALGQLSGGQIIRGKSWENGVTLPLLEGVVKEGDVLIINPERVPIVTRTIGLEEHPPLLLQRIGKVMKDRLIFDRVKVFP
jgi:hypothetical protein